MNYNNEARAALVNAMWLLEVLAAVRDSETLEEFRKPDWVYQVSVDDLIVAAFVYVQKAWQAAEGMDVTAIPADVMQTIATIETQCLLDELKPSQEETEE